MTLPAVLVIREDDGFTAELRRRGIEAVNLSLIRTEPVADRGLLLEKLSRLEKYDGVIVTSPAAAAVFVEHGKARAAKFRGKFYVLGQRAKSVFEEAGLTVEYLDGANTATELIEQLGVAEFAGKHLLFVRGNRSMRTVPALLGTVAEVEEVIVYNTIEEVPEDEVLSEIRERLNQGKFGWVCFFSPSGVGSFVRFFGNGLADAVKAAAIGETTADAARRAGLDVQFVSPKADTAVFAEGVAGLITKNEQ